MSSARTSYTEEQIKKYREFFLDKRCLIAISNSSMRSLLRSVLSGLGVPPLQIEACKNFREASSVLEASKPEIIFTEFEFDEHFGVELSILQKEYISDSGNRLFFLFADSSFESGVAAAAEEEIDAYLLRPISETTLIEYLYKVIYQKQNPSELTKTLTLVKQLMATKDYDRAQTTLAFSQMTLNPHPAIHFYLGYISQILQKHKEALRDFELGLSLNPKHFKSMYGKFMSLYYLGRKQEAHKYVTELKKIYPLTPELLKYAFVVVVETYSFAEVEEYYQLYLKQVRKPDSLKIIVSTALLTCGRVVLRNDPKNINSVLNCFVKGAVISGRQQDFIEGIIQELIAHNMTNYLNQFFDMFKEDEISFKLIKSLRYKQWVREKRDPNYLLNEGKRMIFDNYADEYVTNHLLALAKSMGKTTLIQSLVVRLIDNYPDRRQELAAYLGD